MKNKRQVKELVVLALTKITKNYCACIALYAIIIVQKFLVYANGIEIVILNV